MKHEKLKSEMMRICIYHAINKSIRDNLFTSRSCEDVLDGI